MTDDLRAAYTALEIDPSASAADVRSAYLDLVKVWHPDRYQREPERLRIRAEQKFKDVGRAWDLIKASLEGKMGGDPIPMDFGELWGYVDDRGNTVIHPLFAEVRRFREGLAAVRLTGKWGFIDIHGAFQVHPSYDECGDFHEGLAAVRWYGRWGFVNGHDNLAIPPKFQEVKPFRDGWAEVRLGPRWGRVNRDAQLLFSGGARSNRIE